jgi:spore coat protein U-like protein
MRKLVLVAVAGSSLAAALSAGAATVTTTFAVTATVQKTCAVSANPLAFGTYTPGAGALNANTTLSVRCTKTTPFTVSLNGGSTAGGTVAQRLMAGGTDTLQYNLYTTAAFATVFGDGTGTSATVPGTGTGVNTANTVTVYGQLPDNAVNQAVTPTNYTDTVTVTVTY